MSKLGGFFTRKPALVNTLPEPTPTDTVVQIDNPLEIDEELFSGLGAKIGGDNEALRNLLLDANAKIAELDTIKAAVGKLADPVSKTLRELEAEKAEKISLQTVLNNTRTSYGKLRNEVAELEKKTTTAESEARSLRQDLTTTLSQLHSAEATKAEIAVDIAARRAQIVDLEARLTQEAGDNTALREENRRLDERLSVTEKRIMALESDLNGARQRLLMAEDEKNAQHTLLDRASVETARLARKLSETESSLGAVQGRLRQVEANYAELTNERSRLTVALDDLTERHDRELTTQRMRYDALMARSQATEKLLIEARDNLLAKAGEIRDNDRRTAEIANERDTLQSRVTALDADRVQRDSEIRELEQVRSTLMDRAGSLARAYTSKEAALGRAEEAITALNMRIGVLETALGTHRQNSEQQIEELTASLKREKMERSVLEGALETGRKDCARLMREVMVLQRARDMSAEHQPLAANAA